MDYRIALDQATPVSYELDWGTVRGLCWGDPNDIRVVATHRRRRELHPVAGVGERHRHDLCLCANCWLPSGYERRYRTVGNLVPVRNFVRGPAAACWLFHASKSGLSD